MARQVRAGGNGMPSFKRRLSGTQISQVADYVFNAAKSSGQVGPFEPDKTTIADCEKSNKPFCFRQAFGKNQHGSIGTYGMRISFKDFVLAKDLHVDTNPQ